MAAPSLMLYGAAGYSLGLAAELFKSEKISFIIGGRTESKVKAKALSLGVPYRIFSADDSPEVIDDALSGLKLLVNGAGPFHKTCEQFMDACIRKGVHYTDISAELNSLNTAITRDDAAKKAGVMLIPSACSGMEVMLDCIGGLLLQKVQNPVKLEHTMNINGPVSRGTVGTIRGFKPEAVRRVDGELVPHPGEEPHEVDFRDGRGPLPRFPSNDPQIIGLWRALGVPNISTYCVKTGGGFPKEELESVPEGPSEDERKATPYHLAFKITSSNGSTTSAVVHTANGYDLTAMGTVEAAKAILGGAVKPGFQTPFSAWGGEYYKVFLGTTIEEC
jgi:short subunit dehydrogenase-like uncharacterized protein